MANERQFMTKTRYVATRGVREYRATIPILVNADDVVLELGCEWGTTTEVIARYAGRVIGTDISGQCVDRARKLRPELEFRTLDAYDVMTAHAMAVPFSKIYVDLSGLSGYRGLLDLIALLNTYSAVLEPGTIVVKSGALKRFAQRCTAWR
jgi:trans-aconitate methyltransferase